MTCKMSLPDGGLPNSIKLSYKIVNVLHTLQKVKSYLFHGNSSVQKFKVFALIYFVSVLQHRRKIAV